MTQRQSQLADTLTAEENKLLACIHCGLCLEACPTYVHTGDENDSPRGRIYLMRAVEERRLPVASASFARHIDRCLGCRACESACPAGVEYGQLLEAARADIAASGKKLGWTARTLRLLLRHVWLHPSRLRFTFRTARAFRDTRLPRLLLKTKAARMLLPSQVEFALALLDSSAGRSFMEDESERGSTAGSPNDSSNRADVQRDALASEKSAKALLFEGCVTEGLFARVNRATKRVLEANNCPAHAPKAQVCCGALHAHAGDLEGARALARRNIDAFADDADAHVITNAGGCGAMLVSYGQLLAHDGAYAARAREFSARVRDISQQLEKTGIREGASVGDVVATYDASCHLLHGQRADAEPLRLLRAVPGLAFVPLEGSDVCCGGAGVYNLVEPELSARVLEEKLARVEETGARILATGNPGCHMQIGAGASLRGMPLRVCHPVELLDESYRRAGIYEEEGNRSQESEVRSQKSE
ncbi:MAG TPA: heterodisulfide reductase-related iron-sulfur binding cluster [Pyrinomonadaceae bacterium]|nr:heterodisulfide reductase-related iron-sulfur binding cluster [Pyrinomonadaceae bacterium]